MPLPDFSKLLKSQLVNLGAAFAPDELAYLALTGKIEHAVRDRLAYDFYRSLQLTKPELTVAREWRRVDLAILENQAPCMLLELKAMYSYNMFSPKAATHYPEAIASDFMKMKQLQAKFDTAPAKHFALAILTHPHGLPTTFQKNVVKYSRGILKFSPTTFRALRSATLTNFSEHLNCKVRTLSVGTAFDVKVSIYYCLLQSPQSTA